MALLARFLVLCVLVCSSVHADRDSVRYRDHHSGKNKFDATTSQYQAAKTTSGDNFKFANSIYRLITARETGSIIFSPLSIHAALSMASLGAKGQTLRQFHEGLFLTDSDATKQGYKYLIQHFNNMTGGVKVKVANKIYVGNKFQLSETYKRETRESFYSEAESIDFKDSAAATQAINSWVEANTNNKIRNVVSGASLSAATAMVLVNAVYFKGTWRTKFNPEMTTKMDFFVTPDRAVKVPMMHAKGDFHFRQDHHLDSKILNLHYSNDLLSMVIILPHKRDGLAELESKLTPELLSNLVPYKRSSFVVDVFLPKFKLEQSIELNEILANMGMTDMFSNAANLTGMTDRGQGLKISQVSHKSFIEVAEQGTVAASATVLAVQTLSLGSNDPLDFIADHPFLFFVRHKHLDTVLFMGRYLAPSSAEE